MLNLLALFIGLMLMGGMLVAAEVFLRIRHARMPVAGDRHEDNMSSFIEEMPVLGTRVRPGFHGHHYCRINDEEIYNAEYHIDAEGYRITPVEAADERSQAALFFGCSFTFGLGVEQDESLPAAFARKCRDFLPVNFGVPGYGPQHFWLQIQQERFKELVPREEGVILYGFIDHHIDRLMGQQQLLEDWGWVLPWLEISEKEVSLHGLMNDRIARGSVFLKFFKSLHLGQFVLNRLPLLHEKSYTDEEALQSLTWLLQDIQRRLKDILPGYKLVVFSYPWTPESQKLGPYLERAGIPWLDYDAIYEDLGDHPKPYLFADVPGQQPWGHPKATLYADLATRLAEDLNCREGHSEETEKERE